MADNVSHPRHYADTCSLECIEAMRIAFGKEAIISFCKCNAFKYLWRYKNKNGAEDLQKAKWYCEYGLSLLFNVDYRNEDVKVFNEIIDFIKEKAEDIQ